MKFYSRLVLACMLATIGCRSSSDVARRAPKRLPSTAGASQIASLQPPLALPGGESSTSQKILTGQHAVFAADESSSTTARLVAFQNTDEKPQTPIAPTTAPPTAEMPIAEIIEGTATEEALPPPAPDPVTLDDVITSVYASYPALDAVSRERQIAAAKQLAALGEFDVNLVGESMNEPMGYYKNYRSGLGFKQYNWGGSQSFAGYRIGRGFFEPWYKERQTNDGGEFKAGFAVPFLRNRTIDKRRAAVFQARIDRSAAEPLLQLEVIDAVRAASLTYWDWVAAGQRVQIVKQALDLAVKRQSGMEKRSQRGEIAGIELVDNQRLIVSRQAKLTEAQLKLSQSAIKLSLFLRDVAGTPQLVSDAQIPQQFPEPNAVDATPEKELVAVALDQRPELRLLDLERERQQVEVQQALNLSLPALDGLVAASQDVGGPSDAKRDKSPFELEAGIQLEVPLQRREAQGKLQAAQAKLAQLSAKRRYTEQSIVAEVQAARAAINANLTALMQARQGAELARQMADAERKKLERGDSNVLITNLREIATVEAELLVVEAEADYFMALAQLHAITAAELNSDAQSIIGLKP